MLTSVADYAHFQLVVDMVDIVLCPFLAFGLDFLVGVEFDLVCTSENEFLLHIVLFRELVVPESAPDCPDITNQRKIA
jgi:hypothetical protein